jgi:hypothetical protein
MHPLIPRAEELVRTELSRRNVKVLWQEPIILDQTVTDFLLPKRYPVMNVPIFIDGPPHLLPRVAERDDYVNSRLAHLKYEPLRFPYTVPLSNQRLTEICDAMEQASRT